MNEKIQLFEDWFVREVHGAFDPESGIWRPASQVALREGGRNWWTVKYWKTCERQRPDLPTRWPTDRVLTAEAGAERVALRLRPKRCWHRARKSTVYRCECCGSHHFQVEHHVHGIEHGKEILACRCEERHGHIAAMWDVDARQDVCEWSQLQRNHRWETPFDRRVGKALITRAAPSVVCRVCFRRYLDSDSDAQDSSNDLIYLSPGWNDILGTETFVQCRRCGHEIEFGWDVGPYNRRIWPCESNDFNPQVCVPDCRFRMNWERRGWCIPVDEAQLFARLEPDYWPNRGWR